MRKIRSSGVAFHLQPEADTRTPARRIASPYLAINCPLMVPGPSDLISSTSTGSVDVYQSRL
ncbi:hypothetical protein E4U55_000784, partial [Claviceps digitariae]